MKDEQQNRDQQGGSGRISNPGQGREQGLAGVGKDISHIDQQEGEMNNGTIGRDWEHQSRQDKNENKK